MKVRKVIFAGLGAVAVESLVLSGCGPCPEAQPFEHDGFVTRTHLEQLVANHTSNRSSTMGTDVIDEDVIDEDVVGSPPSTDDLSCEQICEHLLILNGSISSPLDGASLGNFIEVCEFVEFDIETPGDDLEQVGIIACEGVGETPECMGGRRPLGHLAYNGATDELSGFFAGCAHMETASIYAFLELARQLEAWGAPADLVARCKDAAADEVEHARIFRSLAIQEGCEPPAAHQEAAPEDLLSVALHNATEGCVNETWAALVALYQARHADDPALREMYAGLAEDETRHGQLAWDLHDWFLTRLEPADRAVVARAQHEALADLVARASLSYRHPEGVGLPNDHDRRAMAVSFTQAIATA